MDNAKAVCVAKALGWKFHEWNEEHNFMRYDSPDLKYQKMHEAEIEAIAALLDERDALQKRNQREQDLIRYCRSDLHDANLITDDEYVELAKKHDAVKRLEDYDALRAELAKAKADVERLKKEIDAHNGLVWVTREEVRRLDSAAEFCEELLKKMTSEAHTWADVGDWLAKSADTIQRIAERAQL